MKIWYLCHSGFAVEKDEHMIIFDYYKDKPRYSGLEDGVINPEELKRKKVDVVVTHRHSDHFNPVIFSWRYDLRYLRYFLSYDVVPPEDVPTVMLSPGKVAELGDISIQSLESNDEGVAVLVKTPWATIYHAGDLNWWDWSGEKQSYRDKTKEQYCSQIDLLKGEHIDLAFIPADPRLGAQYALGIDYFMRTVGADHCIPMHFGGDYSVNAKLMEEPCTKLYRDKLLCYSKRGDMMEVSDKGGNW